MSEILFNPPLWLPAAGLVVAVVLFIVGNNRVKPPVRNAGLGVLGLVIAWCVAAYCIETRVEACISRTHAIVAAVEASDWKKLIALMDKTTTLEFLKGRDAIAGATQNAAENYQLKNIRIFSTTAVEGPNTVDVTFNSLLDGTQPLTATFRFEYEQRSDGMLLSKIVPLKIGDKSMDEVRRAIR